jgi:hypothetical protein
MNFKLLIKDLRTEFPAGIRRGLLRPSSPFGTATLAPFAAICFVPLMVYAGNSEKPQVTRADAKIAQTSEMGFAQTLQADGSERAKPRSPRMAEPVSEKPKISTKLRAKSIMSTHPYLGTWVTDDGHVRHQLLAGGRYDEARGQKESAYRGRYEITGNHIEYLDDTGFTADGDFVDGVLYHGGMVFKRTGRDQGAGSPRAVD